MRMINADALIISLEKDRSALVNNHVPYGELRRIDEIIWKVAEFPTIDAVPVVRCSECISHGTLTNGNLFCGKRFTGVYGEYHVVKPNDYCSYGKRREK